MLSGQSTVLAPDLLGRITDKLKAADDVCQTLIPYAISLRRSLDSYGRFDTSIPESVLRSVKKMEGLKMKTVYAARLQFALGLGQFWPVPFLSAQSSDAYRHPTIQKRPDGVPKKCGYFCSRSEKIKVFCLWDRSGMLLLAPRRLVPRREEAGLGCTGKDSKRDRMIHIRTRGTR